MIKVLVTGAGGQLAWELAQTRPEGVELLSASVQDLDITNGPACNDYLNSYQPDWVVNAAAYTAVDKAEEERAKAFLVNEQGAANLALACAKAGARMVQLSTDFVFDGAASSPYLPESLPNPLSVYGASKLAGEQAVVTQLPDALVVRTAWLYSQQGHNFVKTMLRLMAEKPQLSVVSDQIGTPTWARGLAAAIWAGVRGSIPGGIYHWTDAGQASWYEFAVAIQEIGLELSLLREAVPINAIPASAYPTPATRPAYSVLDKSKTLDIFGVENKPWRDQLRAMMEELAGMRGGF